jgi:hypothetical protein
VDDHLYSVFRGDADARHAASRRAASTDRALLYVLAPVGALIAASGLSAVVRISGGEASMVLPVTVFSALVLGIGATFHADAIVRTWSRALRVAWFLYAVSFWVFGLACTITFRDTLAQFRFH